MNKSIEKLLVSIGVLSVIVFCMSNALKETQEQDAGKQFNCHVYFPKNNRHPTVIKNCKCEWQLRANYRGQMEPVAKVGDKFYATEEVDSLVQHIVKKFQFKKH